MSKEKIKIKDKGLKDLLKLKDKLHNHTLKFDTIIWFGDGTWATQLGGKLTKSKKNGKEIYIVLFRPNVVMAELYPKIKDEYKEKGFVIRVYPKKYYYGFLNNKKYPVKLILCNPEGKPTRLSRMLNKMKGDRL